MGISGVPCGIPFFSPAGYVAIIVALSLILLAVEVLIPGFIFCLPAE